MLFTRCPDCETTFRITADALRKADGQVRCGRCARVFNAYNELRRRPRRRTVAAGEQAVAAGEQAVAATEQAVAAPAPAPEPPPEATRQDDAAGSERIGRKARVETATAPGKGAAPVRPAAKSASSPSRTAAPTTASDVGSSAVAAATARARAARRESQAAIAQTSNASARITGDGKEPAVGDISFSSVLAELDASTAPDDAEAGEAVKPRDGASREAPKPDAPSTLALLAKNGLSAGGGAPPRAVPDPVERPEAVDTADAPPAWVMLDDPPRKRAATRVWTVGCIVGSALLALQVLHYYRANIAVLGVVGPVIRDAYAMVGAELAPRWDLAQYEIVVDWDAVKQPSADGQSNLTIAARIRNKGPRALPLPHVQVQLKDRWESTIGSRVFAPSEYLPRGARLDRLMTEGQTMVAELDILDPGPQAYGFELDVCVDAEADALRCAADEVFQ